MLGVLFYFFSKEDKSRGVPDKKRGGCQLQCGFTLLRILAAGAHIGSEAWMGNEPSPAKALYGVPRDVTFSREEDWEPASSSAEEELGDEGEEVASVSGAPRPETRTRELTKLLAAFPVSSLTVTASLLLHPVCFLLPTPHCTCQELGKAVPQGP